MEARETTDSLARQFEYALNRFERASQAEMPFAAGYPAARKDLFTYVDSLLARLATVEGERKCWEPGHVYRDAPPNDEEEHRQTRVHCVMCTDAAMDNARAKLQARLAALTPIIESLRRDTTSVGKYAIIGDLLRAWDQAARLAAARNPRCNAGLPDCDCAKYNPSPKEPTDG